MQFCRTSQMKKSILLLIGILSFCSCRTTNQTVNKKREGIWIEKYAIDSAHYKSIGTYKNDDPVKKWKYYLNGKLIKKQRYHKTYCKTKFFHKNRKTRAKGITRLDENPKEIHWYYSGIWKYYDNQRKLTITRNYDKGELISEKKEIRAALN